jgi:rhodanese-related sulfurtransferase
MRTAAIVAIIMVAAVIALLYGYARGSPYMITAEEAKRRIAARQVDIILDVRTPVERATLGSYPGSLHIPAAEIAERVPAAIPNKAASILVYCNTGQRARAATERLRAMGYLNVVYIPTSHASIMA